MARQERKLWCWAAASSAIARHFDPRTAWTQCRVADDVLGHGSCCAGAPDCNCVHSLTAALTSTSNLHSVDAAAAAYGDVRRELRHGRPVAARIWWRAGRPAHFVVVTGCTVRGEKRVRIHDPADGGTRELTFARALTDYGHTGRWTHTYRTRAA
jgi:hypothetical protein